ncbi:hypothetical protein ACFUJR_20550 [Streptomyces sp. NPDC057271]|uniref:hypothetical protein n=1 Tax=unclassified Streptomyces TaxID=2593676 RepID=UPI00363C8C28
MDVKRRRIIVPVAAVVAAVGLAAGTAYVLEVPPFERRGVISSEDVCASLGESQKSIPALDDALPSQSEYSFEDRFNGENVAQGGSSYNAYCFVRGESDMLLSVRSQMVLPESPSSWAADAIGERQAARAEEFDAGSLGVVDFPGLKAAILVPCSAPGTVVGGSFSLSVVVNLRPYDGANEEKVRQRLVDLAVGAAQFAHKDARCDLPSELPTEAPPVSAAPSG